MKNRNPEDLEVLVQELMKDKPNAALVRRLSLKLEIPYSTDLVTQMNTVLQEAHGIYEGSLRRSQSAELEN